MKKFVFKQAKLLALRKQQVTGAELEVVKAAHQAEEIRRTTERELQTLGTLYETLLGSDPNGFKRIGHVALSVRSRLEQQHKILQAKEKALLLATEQLRSARMAAKPLENLEARQREEHRRLTQRIHQQLSDENAMRRRLKEERHAND